MIFLIFFWLFISFLHSKYCTDINTDYCSKNAFRFLKYFFSLLILFHHICQKVRMTGILSFLNTVGPFGVSVFFFISGFGLQENSSKKKYIETFWKKRFKKIVIPYFIFNVLYLIYYICFENLDIKKIINKILSGKLIVTYSWYIVAILYFYMLFYFSFKFFENKKIKKYTSLLIGWILYCIIVYVLGYGVWWFNTSHLFVLGVVWSEFKEKINNYIFNHYYHVLLGLLMIYGLLVYMRFILNLSILIVIFKVTLFVIFVLLVLMKFKFGNRYIDLISNISFEIYLMQGLVISLLVGTKIYNNVVLFSILVIFITVLLSYLLNRFFVRLLK